MKKLLFVLLLAGCATVKPDPIPTAVDIPVVTQKYEPTVTDSNVETVIKVPASTTDTYIKVTPKKLNPFKKHLTNEPRNTVQSNNDKVEVAQPETPGLWKRWAWFVFAVVFVAAYLWKRISSFSVINFLKKLFRKK